MIERVPKRPNGNPAQMFLSSTQFSRDEVEKLKKKALRVMYFSDFKGSYSPLFNLIPTGGGDQSDPSTTNAFETQKMGKNEKTSTDFKVVKPWTRFL